MFIMDVTSEKISNKPPAINPEVYLLVPENA